MDALAQDEEWRDLLRRQSGVVTMAQCRAAGLSNDVVAGRVRGGLWQRLHRTVRLAHPAPPTYEQRVWAALLLLGGRGSKVALCHATALWWVDRTRPVPTLVHVAVLDARGATSRPGVRVHHLPDLGPARVLDGPPPRVRVEHTVIDLVRLCRDVRAVVSLITEVVRSRLTTVALLRATASTRPRVRWREELDLILGEVAQGAMSPLEVEDLRNDRRHGLPVGHRQRGRTRGGQPELVDVRYALPGLRPVAKELDGRLGHAEVGGRLRDMARDTASAVRGALAPRLGWHDLLGSPCAAAAVTAVVLAQVGWQGLPTPCGPSCEVLACRTGLLEEVARDGWWEALPEAQAG